MPEPDGDKQFSNIWNEALNQYSKIVRYSTKDSSSGSSSSSSSKHVSLLPEPGKVTDTRTLLAEIEEHQSQFKEYRERSGRIRSAMTPLCQTVELFSKLAGSAVGNAIPPSAVIFGAISLLVKSAANISHAYDGIVKLFDDLKAFVTRISIHAKHKIAVELKAIMVRKLGLVLVTIGRSAKLIKEGRMLRFLKSTLKGEDEAINAAIEEVNTLSRQENALVQALNLSVAYDTSATLQTVEQTVNDIKDMMSTTVSAPHPVDVSSLMQILKPEMSVQADFDNVANGVLKGTCEWIFGNPLFEAWEDIGGDFKENCLLWISGGPGIGKSHLSAKIIMHLLDKYPQHSATELQNVTSKRVEKKRTSVAYFFCREDNIGIHTFSAIIKTIVYQIARNDPVYARHVVDIMLDPDALAGPLRLWKNLIIRYFSDNELSKDSRVFIVIDGIDEATRNGADGIEGFLGRLNTLENGAGARLRVVMIGRPIMDNLIAETFSKGRVPTIELGAHGGSSDDIQDFITHKISRSKILKKTSKAFKAEINKALKDKTFLWVRLVMDEISTRSRESQIRDCLQKFPSDLGSIIQHVLDRFSKMAANDDDIEDANTLLAWVACANRPLTLDEIGTVMALNSDELEGVIDLERMLRKHYSSLVTLVRNDGLRTADLEIFDDLLPLEGPPDGLEEEEEEEEKINLRSDRKSDKEEVKSKGEGESQDENDEEYSDNDQEITYKSDGFTTTVTISHLSFTEFFRGRRRPLHEDEIGVFMPTADLQVAMTCLQLLCDSEKRGKFRSSSLFYYACWNFCGHLQKALEHTKNGKLNESITDNDLTAVAMYLHKIFTDEDTMKVMCDERWDVGPGNGMITLLDDVCVQIILEWLNHDAVKDCPSPASEWCEMVAKGNGKEIYETLARYVAKRWMNDIWPQAGMDVTLEKLRFIYAYIRKFENRCVNGPDPSSLAWNSIEKAQLDDIIEWAEVDRTSSNVLSYIGNCYSWAVSQRGDTVYLEEALTYFQKAIDIDNNYVAVKGMAYAYCDAYKIFMSAKDKKEAGNRSDEERIKEETMDTRAVGWQRRSLELGKNLKEYKRSYEYQLWYFADWKANKAVTEEEKEEALDLCQQAMEPLLNEYPVHFAMQYFKIAFGFRRYDRWILKMKELTKIPLKKNPRRTIFDAVLETAYEELQEPFIRNIRVVFLRRTQESDSLIHAIRRAINIAIADKKYFLVMEYRAFLGWVYYKIVRDNKAAMDLLEWVVSFENRLSRNNTSWKKSTIFKTKGVLQIVYAEMALAEEREGGNPQPCIEKLQFMVDNEDPRSFHGEGDGHIFLSAWYSAHGQNEQGRKIAKKRVQVSLSLISEVPSLNRVAYSQLFLALKVLGDIRNARAAFLLLHNYRAGDENMSNDDVEDQSGYRKRLESADAENWFGCPGCWRHVRPGIGTRCCMECMGNVMILCRSCYQRMKDCKISIAHCQPDHEYLLLSNCGLPKLESGKVRLTKEGHEPEIMDIKDWLEGLKTAWVE